MSTQTSCRHADETTNLEVRRGARHACEDDDVSVLVLQAWHGAKHHADLVRAAAMVPEDGCLRAQGEYTCFCGVVRDSLQALR